MRFSALLSFIILLAAPMAGRAQQLIVRTETIQPPEMGPLKYFKLSYGRETFTLVPPANWRMQDNSQAAALRFFSQSGALTMTLRFTTNSARETLASTDALRQQLAPDLSDATLIEQFPAYAGDSAGQGVDLSFTLNGRPMRCRVAALPLAGGCVHFVLKCSADEFKTGQQVFGAMLTSFQHAPSTAAKK